MELTVDTEEFDEMSQLNPDAKVFVPVSPTRSNGPLSPPFSDIMNPAFNSLVVQDAVVAQSPRKGESSMMEEDIAIPTEKDFDNEAESRPHEINAFENGNFQRAESPEHLNLKEAMQQDDKLEQEYKDEAAQPFFEEVKQQAGEEYKVLESSFSEYSNGFQSMIDPMSRSFYEGRDDGDILTAAGRTSDVLNSVQPIPTFDDESAFDLGASGDFVAEQFVEEIKGASVEQDKYIDQGLSPTLPDFNLGATMPETVHDAFVTASAPVFEEAHHIEIPTETKDVIEPPSTPETDVQEPVPSPEKLEQVTEEPKVSVVEVAAGAAAVAIAAVVGVEATKKAIGSKTEVKKADAKGKAPAASKANPVPAKRLPASTTSSAPKTATARPASASAAVATSAKPLAARKVATTLAAKPAPKPVSSAPASRPKVPASTVPAGSLPKTASETAAKPAPITRPTATAPKKPLATVPASK